MGSDEDGLREDTTSSPAAENDSAFQAVSSPEPTSEANGTNGTTHDGDQPPPDKVPKRKLSKRKNFTRGYPRSEEDEAKLAAGAATGQNMQVQV